jgi:hypothetical protein
MIYTDNGMKSFKANALLLAVLFSLPGLGAARKEYGPGHIVSVEEKAHERILYYQVNTPVTAADPYYEISLRQDKWLHVTEYTPRHAPDTLPDPWKAGAQVQLVIEDKHHAKVKEEGGRELALIVVRRVPAAADGNSSASSPGEKSATPVEK